MPWQRFKDFKEPRQPINIIKSCLESKDEFFEDVDNMVLYSDYVKDGINEGHKQKSHASQGKMFLFLSVFLDG